MSLVATRTDEQRIQTQFKDKKRVLGTFAWDNSYPTNGEPLQASQIGLDTIEQLYVYPYNGYIFQYIASTGKVKAYVTGAAANAVLAEVPNTTDLSALTAGLFEAIGY